MTTDRVQGLICKSGTSVPWQAAAERREEARPVGQLEVGHATTPRMRPDTSLSSSSPITRHHGPPEPPAHPYPQRQLSSTSLHISATVYSSRVGLRRRQSCGSSNCCCHESLATAPSYTTLKESPWRRVHTHLQHSRHQTTARRLALSAILHDCDYGCLR